MGWAEAHSNAGVDRCMSRRPEGPNHCTGLRPTRPAVRVEPEQRPVGRLVVHNCGHGGAGVTLSWSCAYDIGYIVERLSTS
jgi:D-amino-acid oxidase